MIQLCRHIRPEGTQCTASALRGGRFCHTHQRLHAARFAGDNELSQPLTLPVVDLLFPEDRVAIQTNLYRVADALAAGRIDLGTANAMTYTMRAALANLGQRPLLASAVPAADNAPAQLVSRVILTPEGDQIAAPVERLDAGESEPVHHRACPCLMCAEKYRGWPGELHHADCACGLCEPLDEPTLIATAPREFTATPLRRATAAALLSSSSASDPLSRPWSVADYTFGDSIRRHEAQYAARAAAALAAGIEPPPYQPFDTGLLDPSSEEAAVERDRQQRADQLWAAHFRSLLEQQPSAAAAAPEVMAPENEPAPQPQAAPGRLSLVQASSHARIGLLHRDRTRAALFLCRKPGDRATTTVLPSSPQPPELSGTAVASTARCRRFQRSHSRRPVEWIETECLNGAEQITHAKRLCTASNTLGIGPMNVKPFRNAALLLPLAATMLCAPAQAALWPFGGTAQAESGTQAAKDPLNDQEADKIGDARDQPVERIKLYQKYLEQRIDRIKKIGTSPKAEDRRNELRAKYEEFTRLADELQDNLDTFDAAHADIRKALKELVPASEKWPDVLNRAAADQAYDDSRQNALEAAQSIIGTVKKLDEEQKKYFAEHKDEAGKNGTGPS